MAELSPQQRWDAWMVQAQNFAKREQYIDAIARAQIVVDEVKAAIGGGDGGEETTRLERFLKRAQRRQETFQAAFDEWNGKIAARRAAATAAAAQEMARPLPLAADEPT